MKWAKRIKNARIDRGLTREDLVMLMQQYLPQNKTISVRTLLSWETGQSEPKVSNAIALANALGYQEVSLLFSDTPPTQLNLLGLQRLEEYKRLLLCSDKFCMGPEQPVRSLPVYMQSAAAGTGQWLDDETSEMVEIDDSVPQNAEFGVRLAGDSMEPVYSDGQIVWIKKQETALDGDIILCSLNGHGYCKQLKQNGKKAELISLNSKYKPILIKKEDNLRVFGIVVG